MGKNGFSKLLYKWLHFSVQKATFASIMAVLKITLLFESCSSL